MKAEFVKMEGCGNDYVYIDCVGFVNYYSDKSKLARLISDRHFGVGSDGLIFVNKSQIADFEMEMYNSDGSRGEMCGNGIRCVAKLVYDRGYVSKEKFTIESMGKIKNIEVFTRNGCVETVKVDMGEPILEAKDVPASVPEKSLRTLKLPGEPGAAVAVPIKAGDVSAKVTCVSMGNPHGVIFMDTFEEAGRKAKNKSESLLDSKSHTPSLDTLPLTEIGPFFEHHEMFPNRVNTEFVEVISPSEIRMRVWERGAGETLACGTGCCASVVAAVLEGRTERNVTVHVRGGDININWDESDNRIYMTGPAKTVFTGTYEYRE